MVTPALERLGARERQIVEALFKLGEASVADVRESLADPPSYSAVRAMLGLLEQKGLVRHRRDGLRYLYRAAESAETARKKAIRRLVDTFFGGSPERAVAALLQLPDDTADDVTMDALRKAVLRARDEGR